MVQSVTAIELKNKLDIGENVFLIDVREHYEHQEFNIGGTLIPLNTIFENISLINKENQVVIYCQKGIRSQIAIQRLQQKFGFENLINLQGGMDAWKKSIK